MKPSVLHVNDAAFTAERLIAEARRRGQDWNYIPKAAPAQDWRGPVAKMRRAMIGVTWAARLAVKSRRHDIVHVHSVSTLRHARPSVGRFVLHCHGNDVLTMQYDPSRTATIRSGMKDAEAVFYSTPNLAEHVLPHREDAVYLPVPVDVQNIPNWSPRLHLPRVVFASRWTDYKCAEIQIRVAEALCKKFGDRVEIIGLDWGDRARDAADVGVKLVPRRSHAEFIELLVGANVVVGQAAGLLAVSEMEGMAAGAPLVVPVALPGYPKPPPVLGGSIEDAIDAVEALIDGSQRHDPQIGRRWAHEEHGVERAVDTVNEVYDRVIRSRG